MPLEPTFVDLATILAARERIAPAAVRTPLVALDPARLHATGFGSLVDGLPEILLKDESAQPIGSFKLRGAYNKIAGLSAAELARGVITYSSGNHAQGVAFAARALGGKAVIVMPANAPAIKRDATAALGAEIVTVGNASSDRRRKAEELAEAHGYTIVPPYDDLAIIAGQATCGLEIFEGLRERDALSTPGDDAGTLALSPVSGGGLLSGVSTGLTLAAEAAGVPAPAVWGAEPALAGDAAESFRTRTLVEWPAAHTTRTLADGLRTQSLGERNFAHILRFVGGIVTITEAELRAALQLLLRATDIVAEPSGAVAVAAALFHRAELPPATHIVCVVSGGNLDPALREELAHEAPDDLLAAALASADLPAGAHV